MRRGNEDNLHADANEYRGLFIVADGMGGHAAGEIASQMAVDLLSAELADLNDLTAENSERKLSETLREANRSVYRRTTQSSKNPAWEPPPRRCFCRILITSSDTLATRGYTCCVTV